MRKIKDFGSKIGGAKKDIWALLKELSETEKGEYAQRDSLWKRPNYQKLSEAIPRDVLFWRNEVRKSVKPRPDAGASVDGYIRFVVLFRDRVDDCESMQDILRFYKSHLPDYLYQDAAGNWHYTEPEYAGYFDGNTLLRYVNSGKRISVDCSLSTFLLTKAEKEEKKYSVIQATKDNLTTKDCGDGIFHNQITFPGAKLTSRCSENWVELLDKAPDGILRLVLYEKTRIGLVFSDEEAKAVIEEHQKKKEAKETAKKSAFLPPHLSHIERTGSCYKYYCVTDPNILSAKYNLRGGEFGNYETSKDRLGSLNMAFDAFEDLADVCGIKASDIGLGGDLAIAFGARGRGAAMAHYEPVKNVINITKIRGAGSLAHEWAHALDMFLGKHYGCSGFISEDCTRSGVPEKVSVLVHSFFEQNGTETKFYEGSKAFDKTFQKAGNGYWASAHEMWARAFACFVRDELGDRKSEYLVGHSEFAVADDGTAAIPMGKEREEIDRNFRDLFESLIEDGVFSKAEKPAENIVDVKPEESGKEVFLYTGEDGQLKFF